MARTNNRSFLGKHNKTLSVAEIMWRSAMILDGKQKDEMAEKILSLIFFCTSALACTS